MRNEKRMKPGEALEIWPPHRIAYPKLSKFCLEIFLPPMLPILSALYGNSRTVLMLGTLRTHQGYARELFGFHAAQPSSTCKASPREQKMTPRNKLSSCCPIVSPSTAALGRTMFHVGLLGHG